MSILIKAFQWDSSWAPNDSRSLRSGRGPTKKGNSRVGTSAEAVLFKEKC